MQIQSCLKNKNNQYNVSFILELFNIQVEGELWQAAIKLRQEAKAKQTSLLYKTLCYVTAIFMITTLYFTGEEIRDKEELRLKP